MILTSAQAQEFVEIVSAFERNFTAVHIHGDARPAYLAPTGEEYFVVCARGRKEECESTEPFDTADEALASYKSALSSLIPSTLSVLYWRTKPEIGFYSPNLLSGLRGGWAIYSRFLISDKPVKAD